MIIEQILFQLKYSLSLCLFFSAITCCITIYLCKKKFEKTQEDLPVPNTNTDSNFEFSPLLNLITENEFIDNDLIYKLEHLYEDIDDQHKGLQFEYFLNDFFKSAGFETQLTPFRDDGGFDLYIQKDNKKWAIQAKKRILTNTDLIGVNDIRILNGISLEQGIGKVLITTHYFSSAAEAEAKQYNIELIDKEKLFLLIAQYNPQLYAKAYWQKYQKPLGFCSTCGAPMTKGYNRNYHSKYYQCLNSRNHSGCSAPAVSEKDFFHLES